VVALDHDDAMCLRQASNPAKHPGGFGAPIHQIAQHDQVIVSLQGKRLEQCIQLVQAAMDVSDSKNAVSQVDSLYEDLTQIPDFSICTPPDMGDNVVSG
jgi:hypothetical protein